MLFRNHGKGGPRARLFFFLAGITILRLSAIASGDLLEADLSLDYDRTVWMHAACPDHELSPVIPALTREGPSCAAESPVKAGGKNGTDTAGPPPVSAAWNLEYQNLIHKDGNFAFALGSLASALDLRLRFIPGADIFSSLKRAQWDRFIGNEVVSADAQGTVWESRNAIAFPFTLWVVPVLSIGGDSRGGWEKGLALRGDAAFGFSWSLSTGSQNRLFPLALTTEDSLLSMPFSLAQEIQTASAAWKYGPAEVSWTGRLRLLRRPVTHNRLFTLSDSGWIVEQSGGLAFTSLKGAGADVDGWRASLDWTYAEAQHFFQGSKQDGIYSTQFGYQEVRQRDYSVRGDASATRGRWEAGLFAGTSGLYWDGLRPYFPDGKYLWDRNQVLGARGGIFGIFNRETWLFSGNAVLRQWAAGAWVTPPLALWRLKLGLNYNVLDLETRGYLSKKTSVFILAYSLEEFHPDFPGVRAHLLSPELRLSRNFGQAFLEASVLQAVPVSVSLRRERGGTASGLSGGRSNGYSGGTQAKLVVGWGAR